ncbi:MAG: altronate dehydratase [Clostridia bacterium]|nr:altronate dehydratase [Clostridia bacterium]
MKYIRITDRDNVAVALQPLSAGEEILGVTLTQDVPAGHKFALAAIAQGENVVKYAFPIGHATADIAAGDWVHTHNVKTNLSGLLEYTYNPHPCAVEKDREATFEGYVREDGRVGIRNEVWIVNTVGCVNGTSKALERLAQQAYGDRVDGVHCFVHPYGCSQLGEDHRNTQKLLASMVRHPNAGAVLVLGLGCENNNVAEFKKVLGDYNPDRVKFLITQEVEDEIEAGMQLLDELTAYAAQFRRQTVPASELIIGLKCGGSDGLSGITANPLLGAASDLLARHGGTTLLTEVPEMFGAETILMDRCKDKATFDKAVALINDFKAYFIRYNQVVYENPSPGNKAGGITTLEDKSLGCTQKGGTAEVRDVLAYCEPVKEKGLNLVQGPGNDLCAITALMGSGAQMVLFTTGRGTPVGAPIPTVKVATNTPLAEKKKNWIDFNAGVLVQGKTMEETSEEFFAMLLEIASGKQTRSEEHDYREIAIFKDGVTL